MKTSRLTVRLLLGGSAFVQATLAGAHPLAGGPDADPAVPVSQASTNTTPGQAIGAASPSAGASPPSSGGSVARPAPDAGVPGTDAASSQQSAATTNDIVVTGSRVITNGATSPTPLTTIAAQTLQVAAPSGTLSDALNTLPVFSGSRTQFSNGTSNATGVSGGNGSANVLNLRNLGPYRTLILFDGHRVPPSLFNSTVDVDIIPQELISRVDVVTAGVSAVYGSDAISGVVNFIPNRHFNGVSAHAEAGISDRGDAATRDIGVAAGTDIGGGRGHIEASFQHRDNDGILDRVGSRSWLNLAAVEGAGTAANPYHLVTNVHLTGYTFGGLITGGALAGQQFGSNGVLSPFVAGAATGTTSTQIGGSGAYQDASMIAPLSSNQFFARLDYDLTSDVHVFLTGAANLKTNTNSIGWNTLNAVTLSAGNAFLAPAYRNSLAAAGQSTFALSEILSAGPRIFNVSHTEQYYLNGGVEGSLGRFKWDVTYSHGTAKLHTRATNILNQQNLAAALDAVTSPTTGQPVCYASLTNSAYAGCVPLNVFGATAPSQAALNYVLTNVDFRTLTQQDSVDGSIHGRVLDDWAGPVTVALSGEWRRQSLSATSNGLPNQLANCTSLRYNCTATTTLYSTTYPYSPTVAQSVAEGAIEAEIPLLRDFFLAKAIDLNAAARYTDYSTSGHYVTWKAGATWDVEGSLKFRSTVSHDIRAPTLYDLYQPTLTVNGNFTDALNQYVSGGASRTVYVPSINIGNPALTAENGYTLTIGAVFQPRFIPGLTLTVDHYRTLVKNAIISVQGFAVATQNACYASGGTSPYCALIIRPGGALDPSAANAATAFYIQPQNLARIRTFGVDFDADYQRQILGHPAGFRFLLNYQPHIYYIQPGTVTIDQGGAGWGPNGLIPAASVQIAGFVNYNPTSNFRVDVFERYRNAFNRSGVPGQIYTDPVVGSYATTTVTFTWDIPNARLANRMAVHFSVSNLFDKDPPLSGYYSGQTSAGSQYEFSDDPIGRAYYFGVNVKL